MLSFCASPHPQPLTAVGAISMLAGVCAKKDTALGYAPMSAVARFTLVPLAPSPPPNVSAGWVELTEGVDDGEAATHVVEGWFEAPVSATYLFLLRTDVESTLSWTRCPVSELLCPRRQCNH